MINTIQKLGLFLKWCALIALINIRIHIRFFTLWGIIIQILYYSGPLKKYQESILYI